MKTIEKHRNYRSNTEFNNVVIAMIILVIMCLIGLAGTTFAGNNKMPSKGIHSKPVYGYVFDNHFISKKRTGNKHVKKNKSYSLVRKSNKV